MPEPEDIGPEKIELIERRLTENITQSVHSQLFRWYIALGGAVAAIIGFLGWDILAQTRQDLVAGLNQTKQEMVEEFQTVIIKPYADQARAINTKMEVASELHDRAIRSLDKIDEEIAEARPKMLSVDDMSRKVDELGARARDLEGLVQQLDSSTAELLKAAQSVQSLGDEVKKLANAVHTIDPTATVVDISNSVATIASNVGDITKKIAAVKNSTTVYFQYYAMPPETADQIVARLTGAGFTLPGKDNEPMRRSGMSEVRFFNDADATAADRLAAAANTILSELDIGAHPVTVSDWGGKTRKLVRPGTIELWVGLPALASPD